MTPSPDLGTIYRGAVRPNWDYPKLWHDLQTITNGAIEYGAWKPVDAALEFEDEQLAPIALTGVQGGVTDWTQRW